MVLIFSLWILQQHLQSIRLNREMVDWAHLDLSVCLHCCSKIFVHTHAGTLCPTCSDCVCTHVMTLIFAKHLAKHEYDERFRKLVSAAKTISIRSAECI